MTVVAEGVETAEQHHHVRGIGCDSCKGYYFARPMAADTVDQLFDRRTPGQRPRLPVLYG